jgi:hypothetical protein
MNKAVVFAVSLLLLSGDPEPSSLVTLSVVGQ